MTIHLNAYRYYGAVVSVGAGTTDKSDVGVGEAGGVRSPAKVVAVDVTGRVGIDGAAGVGVAFTVNVTTTGTLPIEAPVLESVA
jgi:hypothetical protein